MVNKKAPGQKSSASTRLPIKSKEASTEGINLRHKEVLSRVRQASWTGHHDNAIALVNQVLSEPDAGMLGAATRMDFLDLMAESKIAIGNLEQATQAASAMLKIANRERKAALKAQAFNRKSIVEMRSGDLKSALSSAETGSRESQRAGHKPLIAESYFRLSEAQWRLQKNEPALENAQKAIALYQELGDDSGTGRAYWSLANAYSNLSSVEAARRAAQMALEFCRRAGDQYGIGNAFNGFMLVETDLAERIDHTQQAHLAFEAAGYTERQGMALGNLALTYSELGLYSRSLRLQREVVNRNRAMGARVGLAYAMGNLIDTEVALRMTESARTHLKEYSDLVDELGDPTQDAALVGIRGSLAFADGDYREAIQYFKSAVGICEVAKLGREDIFLTELGKSYLSNNNPSAALKATKRATDFHRSLSFAKPDGFLSQAIWWRHVQALLANKQAEQAHNALDLAYGFLIESIQNIRDVGLRRNYLNKVVVNRELIGAWVSAGARQKLPPERLFSYLTIESNLREPFKRLADTGLRLNALRSISEIQTFLVDETVELTGAERVLLILDKDSKLEVANSQLPLAENQARVLGQIRRFLDPVRTSRSAQLLAPSVKSSNKEAGAEASLPPSVTATKGLSRIIAPLIAQNQLLGYLYVDMTAIYGLFDETDRDMVGMLANQAAVALDNAGILAELEEKVAQRTSELSLRIQENERLFQAEQDRAAELAIINSVQAALAAELNIQGIYDAVGDKIREIFKDKDVGIRIYDPQTNLLYFPYVYEGGERVNIPPVVLPGVGFSSRVLRTRETIVINENLLAESEKYGSYTIPGTKTEKSKIIVPLVVGDQVRGMITLDDFENERAFSQSDVRLLQTLANSMSVALENARLFDETQRLLKETEQRNAELAIINSVQEGLASKLDIQAIFDLVGDKVRDLFDAQVVVISTVNQATNIRNDRYVIERGQRFFLEPRQLDEGDGGGFGGHVIRTRQPLMINRDVIKRGLEFGSVAPPAGEEALSILYVPLLVGDEAKGLISLQNLDREDAFTESDVRVLSTLASSMSVALENARLFDETTRLLKETEQRNAELAIINSVQAALAAKLDMQGIYDVVGDKIRDIFDAQSVQIVTYDPQTTLMSYPYLIEKGQRQTVEAMILDGKGIMDHAISERRSILINTDMLARTKEITGSDAVLLGGQVTKSRLDVPMMVGGEARGGISLQNVDRENAFTEADQRLLETLTNSMSVALENARLFNETQRLFKAEQERVAELAIINSIQQGLASKLDLQAIVDLVGDKLREVLNSDELGIRLYDEQNDLLRFPYEYEHGKRLTIEPQKPSNRFEKMRADQQPIYGGTSQIMRNFKVVLFPGTEISLAFASVPIIAGSRVIGEITVESFEREDYFNEANVRLMQTIAASMGVALESARLFDETTRLLKETEQRNAELAVINSIQQGVAASLDFQTIVDLAGDKLREVLNTGEIGIRWFDYEHKTVHYLYEYEHGERLHFPPQTPPIDWESLVKRREPLVRNTAAEVAATRHLPGTDTSQSDVDVQIIGSDRVIGSIIVEDYEHEHAYSESDIRLLTTVASSMGVALENARLFDETQRLFKAEQERVAELAIINSIQQGLASKLDLQAIVDLVGDKLREILNSDELGIRLYDEQNNLLRFPYEIEHGKRLTVEPQKPTERFSQMRADQQPIFGSTLQVRQRFNLTLLPGTENSLAVASVPIIAGSAVIGEITVESFEREDYFNESNIRLMQTIAASMGVALENARLFDETTRLLKETEQRNAELAVINSIQQGVAASLDFKTIIDLVGDKLREVLNTGDLGIRWFDYQQKLVHYMYEYEHGERLTVPSRAPIIGWEALIQQREPLVRNTAEEVAAAGTLPGTDTSMSNVAVPIIGSDRVIGSIIVEDYDKEYAYSDSDVRLLTTVASSMGVALENARLFDETQRLLKETEERNAELAVINSVQAALAAELNIQGIYDAVGDKIREIFHNTDMNIRIYDPKTNLIQFPYMYENGERLSLEPAPLAETGFANHVLRSRETVVINQNLTEEEKKYGSYTITGTESEKAVVFVPLVVGDQARGLINLASMHENAFSDSDVRLLQTLANSMSVALENARLFDETQRLLKETEQRNAELAIINSVQEGLVAKVDMQGIYELVGDKVRDIFQVESILIMRGDPDTGMAVFPYNYEKGVRYYPGPRAIGGITGLVMKTRQPVMINENLPQREEELLGYATEILAGEDIKSRLDVPMMIADQVTGVISLQSVERENAFSESDLRLLQTLANSMSVALENARLFDESQRLLKITEERAEELAIINSVQAGLAAQLNIQAIFDLVGDKVRDTFDAQSVVISTYDRKTNLLEYPYMIEKGLRQSQEPLPLTDKGFTPLVMRNRQPLMINENLPERFAEVGSFVVGGGEMAKSGIWVPLVIGDEARGTISIQNVDRENAFSESDFRLLTTLASSLSVAFENARLFDETQRLLKETEQRNAELAIINKVQQGLASKLEMQAIYDLVGDEIQSIFDAQAVLIVTYDQRANLFYYPYNMEKGKRYQVDPTEPMGFSAEMIKTRQPILIKNNFERHYEEITHRPLTRFSGEEPKSWLGVPLMVGNEVRGTISLQNVDRENAYNESDLRLLNTLAGTMSVALENARLFNETQRLLKETEQRAQELAIINSVQEGLASKLDVQGIVELVGEKISTVFGIQDLFIGLYDPASRMIHYPYGMTGGVRDAYGPVKLGKGLSSRVIQDRSPLVINSDMGRRSAELGAIMDRPRYQKIKSWVGVPMVVGNEAIGLISLQDVTRENAFADSQINLLTTLANSMSVALENARLFDETTRLLKETEQRAAELAIINSVQEGLASKLEMQLIYDLVGNKICEIFNLQTCFIMLYDRETETELYPFMVEDGIRQEQEPIPHDEHGFGPLVMRTKQPVMINEKMVKRSEEVGSYIIGGGTAPKSAIYVPLLIGGQAKGVISVQNTQREHAFTDSDLRLLTTLASSMSVALESARLFGETEQRAAELAIINSVQAGLASKLDMQAIYELVGEKLRELFDMQAISLVSFDLEKDTYHYHYLLEKGQRLDVPDAQITPMGKHIIRTRKTLLVNDHVEENLAKIGVQLQIIPGTEPTKALLRVPILIGKKVRGFIGLSNLEKENAFSESDVRLLETLASSLSVALDSARLFEETKRNAAELATVNTVSSALASELDTSALIQLVGEQIRNIFRAEIAYVALLAEDGETIKFPYQYGEDLAPISYGEGLTSKIIETGKPLLINTDVNREVAEIGATIVGLDVQSYLGVPILVGGRPVGVVSVQSTSHENAFDENDQRLMGTIAANVGSALHNAQLYKEAQESRAAAEQANKAKSTFLANMSHELRTPLNAIIGFTRIVRRKAEGALPDKQLENLDKVLSSSEHLLSLINTVLDIAKIEAGRMDVIPANFNIAGLADSCANLTTPLLRPSVNLEKHVNEGLGLIYSDQDKIKQIVINLLSNAAKFTHEGKIVLSVGRYDEDKLDISVADTGIGISEEALGRIFEEFQQADTSTTRKYGGTGLGLAISRSLARLLGGDLTATSELNKGSTFTLRIPIKYGTKPAQVVAPSGASEPKEEVQVGAVETRRTVLVIDDDPDAVYLLQENLNKEEFKVIGTRNGHEGLQVAREQQPDAILLDILMPEVDGWQVLNDLKEDPATNSIPVILLTIVDKKALGFRLGATAYLLKPLDPTLVIDTLRRVIKDKDKHLKHVLVVDDDPNVPEMLRQILTEPEFELESAEDGEAGLRAIEARHPDIILLDLMMPKLDGFGVIEKLRADPETRHIPVIVISAKELTDEESKKLRATVAFVMKKQGFDSQKLMQELNEAMLTPRS